MLTDDFDYALPPEAVAQRAAPRGTSRLLVLNAPAAERHRLVSDLPRLLRGGDLVVVNNTRVLPARLFARLPEGGKLELFLVERRSEREWDALAKPGRRARPGLWFALEDPAVGPATPTVEVLAKSAERLYRLRFSEPIEPHLERLGHVPLPPYIKRADEAADRERYQTVFAHEPGAIAAPTAGLHFTAEILADLAANGIELREVTLHVGIGTFKPVTAALVHEHRMESERYEVGADTAAAVARTRAAGGRVVAIGTTVVRTLESAAARAASGDPLPAGSGRTELFITPGYRFRVVDVLLTNFHLPRSTLLMLVSAFAGRERVLAAYGEAMAAGYRFYSYGDAMLAERAPSAG
jgi:S-adenosylmethionine:tRNA ribosyltransferase-isomerase